MKYFRNRLYNFLRWSEKYIKTDMLYLAKGGSWLTLGQGVGTISGLILAVGFANLLPKEVYGNYNFILALGGIVGTFTLTGMRTAIVQAVARGFDGTLQQGFRESLKWSVLMVTASVIGASYYFFNKNNTIGVSLLIIGVLSPFMISTALYSGFLNGKKDFKTGTIFNIFTNIIPAASMLTTIFFTKNIILIVLVYFISRALVNSFFYIRTLKKYKPAQNIDPTVITYSKHLSVMNILSTVADYLDKILVFHYLGAAQLAIYAFAVAIPTQLRGLLRNINSLILPKFAANEESVVQKSLYGKILQVGLISLVFVGMYIIAAPFIYKIFFPQYLESVFYSQIFSLIIIPSTIGIIPGSFLVAQKKQKSLYITNVSSPLIRIGMLLALGYFYGIIGIILAVILSKIINALILIMLSRKT